MNTTILPSIVLVRALVAAVGAHAFAAAVAPTLGARARDFNDAVVHVLQGPSFATAEATPATASTTSSSEPPRKESHPGTEIAPPPAAEGRARAMSHDLAPALAMVAPHSNFAVRPESLSVHVGSGADVTNLAPPPQAQPALPVKSPEPAPTLARESETENEKEAVAAPPAAAEQPEAPASDETN